MAKFFLLIHLTATSKLCFFKLLEVKEIKKTELLDELRIHTHFRRLNLKFTSLCLPLNTTAKDPWPIKSCLLNSNLPTDFMVRLQNVVVVFKLVRDEGFPTEADAVRPPCRRRPPCYWQKVWSSQLVGIVAENINIDKDMSKFFSNKHLTKKLEQTTSVELVGSFVAQLLPFLPQTGVKHCLRSRRDQVLLSLGNPHATGLRPPRGACAERSVTVIMARSGAPRKKK